MLVQIYAAATSVEKAVTNAGIAEGSATAADTSAGNAARSYGRLQ